jgi:hypothetical protein
LPEQASCGVTLSEAAIADAWAEVGEPGPPEITEPIDDQGE